MSYDASQRNAVRVICAGCQQPYDVTNRDIPERFVCVWCAREKGGADTAPR